MTADDDLRRAWAAHTLRFADPHDPARHSETTIRDAFEAGYRAALAARSEPRAEGLDVERLARALDNGLQLGQPWTGDASYDDFLLACARDIAREYAALAPEQPE